MATTDNLDIELVSENALQLDPIINEALATIDSCLAGASTYDFESDANYTLTDEYFTAYLNFTDSGPVLTTGRDVIYPAAFPIQIVTNSTAEDLQLKVSGQTGITLTSGSTSMIYANGSDVVTYGAAGGFSSPMTTAGDLILGGASGAAGRLAIGTSGYVLTSNGTTAAWAAAAASGVSSVNGNTGALTLTAADVPTAINAQTGTSYTLVLADASKVVTMSNASANTLTIPPNSSVAIPVGHMVEVWQIGAGQTTIAAGSGVTISYNTANTLKLAAQYSGCSLRKVGTDTWYLVGDMEAAP